MAMTPPPDYSSQESEAAVRAALPLILELRQDRSGSVRRRVALYERTLGLAVIPVLVGRALRSGWRRVRGPRPDTK